MGGRNLKMRLLAALEYLHVSTDKESNQSIINKLSPVLRQRKSERHFLMISMNCINRWRKLKLRQERLTENPDNKKRSIEKTALAYNGK